MMRRSPVVGAAFGLLFFYWIALFLFDLLRGQIGLSSDWVTRMSDRGMAILAGAIAGVVLVGYGMWLKRHLARMRLIGDDVRGVRCSIGELPVMLQAPEQAEKVIPVEQMRLPKHKCIDRDWMRKWFAEYESAYPAHARMLRACERVINSKPDLPAACKNGVRKDYAYGYDGHNHGNHTLVEHAYVTAAVGIHLSGSFEFDGSFVMNDRGEKEGVSKKNPNYRFSASDPLIALLCYAHDLGKLETFGVNEHGEVIALEGEHDLAGARMMARMDEFWELPDEDRMILLLAVSNYHKPSKMPMDRNGQLISDRCQALLELMIEADIRAGLIENGQEDELGKKREVPIVETTYTGHLWEAFTDLVIEAGRINGQREKFGIGQKNVVENRTIIVVYEKDVRDELLKRMELRNSQKGKVDGKGVTVLTKDLLRVLGEKGMLITEWGDAKASCPEEALWQVDWYGRDPKRLGAPISKSLCTIVFEPKGELARLAEMKDHDSIPKLVGLFGDEKREEKRKAVLRDALSMATEVWVTPDENGVLQIAGESKKSESKKKAARTNAKAVGTVLAPEKNGPEQASKAPDKERQGAFEEVVAASPSQDAPTVATRPAEQNEKATSTGKKTTPKREPVREQDVEVSEAVEAVKAQLRRRMADAQSKLGADGRTAPRIDDRTAKPHPVKAGLLNVVELVRRGDLPFTEMADGRIAVAVEALKALNHGSIPWMTQQVVTFFVSNRWPGVKITRRDNGVFMLELDVPLVERTEAPQIEEEEQPEA